MRNDHSAQTLRHVGPLGACQLRRLQVSNMQETPSGAPTCEVAWNISEEGFVLYMHKYSQNNYGLLNNWCFSTFDQYYEPQHSWCLVDSNYHWHYLYLLNCCRKNPSFWIGLRSSCGHSIILPCHVTTEARGGDQFVAWEMVDGWLVARFNEDQGCWEPRLLVGLF